VQIDTVIERSPSEHSMTVILHLIAGYRSHCPIANGLILEKKLDFWGFFSIFLPVQLTWKSLISDLIEVVFYTLPCPSAHLSFHSFNPL